MSSRREKMRYSSILARNGRGRQAEPAPSATVVVARAVDPVPEFLLVKRHAGAAFGASHVFPGGLVEAQDRAARSRCRRPSLAANRDLEGEGEALDYCSAAVRELFEETGLLLACDEAGQLPPAASGDHGELYPKERLALLSGELSWPEFLERHGLTVSADRLTWFAWWITPTARSARFSTWFFLADLPPGQVARHDGRELTDSCWITAQDALVAAQRGDLKLPPPTVATLRELAAQAGLGELQAWARRCEAGGVSPVLPIIETRSGRERIIMPGDAEYPVDAAPRR
jgi:8-oxo-dGTP pyrophosphatase MutT (NUDIX family)